MNILTWLIIGLVAGSCAGRAITAQGRASIAYLMAGIVGAVAIAWLASLVFGAEFLARLSLVTVLEIVLGMLALVFILRCLPDKRRV